MIPVRTCSIEFEADEWPKWRKEGTTVISVQEMIDKIVEYQSHWDEQKESINTTSFEKVYHNLLTHFFCHVCIEEGQGCTTKEEVESCLKVKTTLNRSLSRDESITVNLQEAYNFLLGEVKKEHSEQHEELHGLLEISLITEAHKLVLKDIELPKNSTKPGEFSQNERCTTFQGEVYYYQKPENMEGAGQILVDSYNFCIKKHVKEEQNPKARVYNMFKICSWLLYELLDLHPFSDGNGRLCRLLCAYALSSMTPFPTPIYNVWSESKNDDYVQALVDARKSTSHHPTSLLTMIIECNYFGWKNFFDELGQ